MSVLWTHKTASVATDGQAIGTWDINGISIDTRSLQIGDLFVPLKDIRDGHDFIPMAYEKGAGAVLSEHMITDAPALIVDDVLKALGDLAIAARQRSKAKRIAVTGSVGKTSVKEMLAHVCRSAGKTHASIKSYNNHWGVPLTLATMPHDTDYGVFEMGMNHAGELSALTQIVRPDIAVITKIAGAHLEHFGTVENIAKAKAEIFEGLREDGIAVLPRDSEFYDRLADQAKRALSFGRHADADAQIVETQYSAQGSRSVIELFGQALTLDLPMAGAHWVENAACVLLAAHVMEIESGIVCNALKNMYKIQGRGAIYALEVGVKSVTLIDESYNANPTSMGAAIATLGLNTGRKIAVLGDMLELGSDELALHSGLLAALKKADVDQVLCCGSRMKSLHEVLPETMRASWSEHANDCLDGLKGILENNDTVMVKGSNASGMGKLVNSLLTQYNTKDK